MSNQKRTNVYRTGQFSVLELVHFIKKHPSEEGRIALKEYHRVNIITIIIILVTIVPLTLTFTNYLLHAEEQGRPANTAVEARGHISQYENTFWYTDSSQKYTFSMEEYTDDSSYEPGEIIRIFLDEEGEVISIAHKADDKNIIGIVILTFGIPILALLTHATIGRKIYAKHLTKYGMWFFKELAPYQYSPEFEKIVAQKKFYDVRVDIKTLDLKTRKRYYAAGIKRVVYFVLFVMMIGISVHFANSYGLTIDNPVLMLAIVAYTVSLYLLITRNERIQTEIKQGYEAEKDQL